MGMMEEWMIFCNEKLKKFKDRTVNRAVNCQESLPRSPRVLANRIVTM